jgi:CheY-like chemotaxis protein
VKLLEIQSSPGSESSDSITLAAFIDKCKSCNMSTTADALDVSHEGLPEVACEAIRAKYKAVKHETKTEVEPKAWERFQSLVLSFHNNHEIVLLWFPSENEGGGWALGIVMRAAVISQLMLPNGIGHEIWKAVQAQQTNIPSIIGARTSEVVDKVLVAMESAARDNVNKPVGSPDAEAGIERGLLHRQEATTSVATCTFGECEIDFVKMTARRAGKPFAVTTLEFKLLKYFLNN